MLSQKEGLELQERKDFWEGAYRAIGNKNFNEAKNEIDIYSDFLRRFPKDENYISWLLRDIGWLRDELDATQKGKPEFEEGAKNVVTALNRLILIIITQIIYLPEEKREPLLERANSIFDPIFMTISEEKEGYAYFGRIEHDREYYSKVYSKMIEEMKKEFPEFSKKLLRFENWKKEYDEEFARKVGLMKNG